MPISKSCVLPGLLMALLTERCLFINFPFYHKTFLSEVDFSWEHHTQRLMSFGHDVNKTPPHQIQVCDQAVTQSAVIGLQMKALMLSKRLHLNSYPCKHAYSFGECPCTFTMAVQS